MKGFNLLSAVALMTLAFTSVVFAQKSVISPTLIEKSVRTVTLTGRPIIHRVDLRGDFQPAQPPDPYVYLQTMFARWNDAGSYGFSFGSFAGGITLGDDVVLLGGEPDPVPAGYSTTTPVACISEISLILISIDPNGGSLRLRLGIHRWNGLFTAAALAPQSGETFTVTIPNIPPAPPGGLVLIPVTVSVSPRIAVPKAFWVAMTPLPDSDSTINLANIGPLIANSTPGNVSMLPGRGYYRATSTTTPDFTNVTGGSVFAGLPQGSFYLAIRGRHNFVGTVDLSALNNRAKPSSPLAFEFDDDPADDPDEGIEEALRRNIVDVEVVNDSDPQNPFTSRFTTYLDENGRFTLPVTNAIASITVRRWDNGLKVTFNRLGGWSTDVCNPTEASQTMTFGDVSGDGIIDDADLLAVLFNFGNSE
jgi:hypothetical protein